MDKLTSENFRQITKRRIYVQASLPINVSTSSHGNEATDRGAASLASNATNCFNTVKRELQTHAHPRTRLKRENPINEGQNHQSIQPTYAQNKSHF